MENSATTIENLIEKIEAYVTTNFDLLGSNVVYKLAEIFSVIAVKLSITIVVVLSFLIASIGLSL